MSNPPIPFDRQANFTAFFTEQFPTVGQNLEAEFRKLQQVTGSTQSRLAEIQRDDGELKNQSVHPDALNQDVRALLVAGDITVRGAWAAGTVYAPKNIVRNTGGSYLAVVAHTAGANFDADFAAGKWLLLAGSGSTGPVFDGTFNQNVMIAPPSGQAELLVNAPITAQQSAVTGQKAGKARWKLVLGNTTPETGANAGSDFALFRFSDTLVPSSVISASRATGQVTFASRPSFDGNTPWDTGNFDPAAKANLSGATFTGGVSIGPLADAYVEVKATGARTIRLATTQGANYGIYDVTAALWLVRFDVANKAYFAGACEGPDFKSTSDERLKEDIKPLRRGLDALKRMLPREYVKDGRREIGFIAQDARRVIPEAVDENQDGYLSLSYGQVTALVASAVLELEARVARITALAVVSTCIAAAAAVIAWI